MVQVDPEARRELPGQHRGGLAIEDPIACQTAGQDLDRALTVDAGGLQQHDRLADQ